MAVTVPKRDEPYNLDPSFERSLVTLACSRPRFFGRVGHAVDADMLGTEEAKVAMRAAQAIYKEVGRGPDSCAAVLQRLRRWMGEGKVRFELIKQVNALFDLAEDIGLMNEESVTQEITPILQFRIRDEAILAGMEAFAQKRDLSKAFELEQKALRVGEVDTSIGVIMGPESFNVMAELSHLDRLRTGIVELDAVLDGGLHRGGLGVAIGGSGDGKSMFLSSQAGVSLRSGLNVAYATLELPRSQVLARVKANITGIPINELLTGSTEECKAMLNRMALTLGLFAVEEFTPHATTPEDVIDWVKRLEEQSGRRIDVLIVDYGDKLAMRLNKKEKEQNDYVSGLKIFEGLRTWAHASRRFCWTASQANRQKDKKKKLDLNDVAESLHKIRVADLVITLNVTDGSDDVPEITIRIAKHRTGRARVDVGPYQTEYACGRVCAMNDEAFV